MKHFKTILYSGLIVCCIAWFAAGTVSAQNTTTKTFTANTAWTVPANVTSVTIECWGGGGKGADMSPGPNGGGGGGGGAYASSIVNVTPGQSLTVTVGGQGAASQVIGNGNILVKAVGGSNASGTTGGAGGQASACIGTVKYSGGNGGAGMSGSWAGSGGGGAAAGALGNGGNGGNGSKRSGGTAGTTTSPNSGNGGAGLVSHIGANNGNAGSAYGGGGSGCVTATIASGSKTGGAGAQGLVCITYTSICSSVTAGAIAASNWTCTATDSIAEITGSTAGTPAGGTYSWRNGTTTITDANAEYYAANASGSYTRGYTYPGCATQYTSAVVLTHPGTINPGTITAAATSPVKVCEGNNYNVNISANTTRTETIHWQKRVGTGDWTNLAATGTTYSESLTNLTEDVEYRFYITIGTGCTIYSNSTYQVKVQALPVFTMTVTEGSCPTGNFTVVASTTNVTDPTYRWNCNGEFSTTSTLTLAATCGVTYTYDCTVTDGETGCSKTLTADFTYAAGAVPESAYYANISNTETISATIETGCKNTMPDVLTYVASKFEYPATMSGCTGVFTAAYPAGAAVPAVGTEITEDVTIDGITVSDACGNVSTQTVKIIVKFHKGSVVTVTSDNNNLCQSNKATLTANVTPAGTCTYVWSNDLGNTASVEVPYNTAVASYTDWSSAVYSVTVTDSYGCTGIGSTTLRFAPLVPEYNNASDNICATTTGYTKSFTPSSAYEAGFERSFTWTVKSNPGNIAGAVDNTTTRATAFSAASLTNSGLASATVVYTVTPYQTGNGFDCTGEPFEFALTVKPSIANTGALTYDDADVVTTLYYGACDTLLHIATPNITTAITEWANSLVITNDASSTYNSGALLGRLAPGTKVITWTVTDPCGNQVSFDKKYIVNYPACGNGFTVTDADGNVYETVRIGCECWTKSNLKSTKYSNGTAIASANGYTSNEYPNADENIAKFGRLYTWYSAMNVTEGNDAAVPATITDPQSNMTYVQGVCPEGWAVPAVSVMQTATSSVADISGMKTTDESMWLPGAAGTDATGFKAVAAGYYDTFTGKYLNLLGETFFWSCENATASEANCMNVSFYCPQALYQNKMKGMGYSVRCVRRAN